LTPVVVLTSGPIVRKDLPRDTPEHKAVRSHPHDVKWGRWLGRRGLTMPRSMSPLKVSRLSSRFFTSGAAFTSATTSAPLASC
jgi:hypothetical protein